MENQNKHRWVRGKKWDTCSRCGCIRVLIVLRRVDEKYYEYSRSKSPWSRARPDCLDWDKLDGLDNDPIEDFYEVK